MTVLAIASTHLIGGCDDTGPDRSRCTLRHGLELEGRLAGGGMLGVDIVNELLQRIRILEGVTAKLRGDAAGMDGGGADAVRLVAAVEFDGEENVRRLGAAIGLPGVIGGLLEIGIVEIDIRETMPGGGKGDEARAVAHQGRDAIDEDESGRDDWCRTAFRNHRRCGRRGRP